MSYKVKITPRFEKDIKRLAKKYVSLRIEYPELVKSLQDDPTQGTALGNSCYKIRVSIASKGKGKSAGARAVSYLQIVETTVYLLTIYDKGEQETISPKELQELIKEI